MANELRQPLSPSEQRQLQTQLALFWYGGTPQERNAYANVLVFLVLAGEDVIAPAAFEIIVYDIIKSPSTRLPWSTELDDDFRNSVAAAVMDKLRAEGIPPGQTTPRPWRYLASYQRDHDVSTGNFRAWLRQVSFTTAVDLIRRHPMSVGSKRNRRWVRPVPLEEWDEATQSLERWYSQTPLPLRLDVMRALDQIANQVGALPKQDWDALRLRVDAELEYRQIAEHLNCTPEAVRKRIERIRDRLKHNLGNIFDTSDA